MGIANLETKRGGAGAFWWRAWQERKRREGQTQRGSIPNQRWERPTDTQPCKPDAVRRSSRTRTEDQPLNLAVKRSLAWLMEIFFMASGRPKPDRDGLRGG